MFNLRGEVIGIVSHMLSQSGGSDGVGFAVTSNTAMQLLRERMSFWSGLRAYPLDGKLAAQLNLPQPAGLLVLQRAEDSPAARMGLRAGTTHARIGDASLILGGDIILEVAAIPIEANVDIFRKIRERLRAVEPGEELTIKVLRTGRIVELSASAAELNRRER